MSNRIAIVAVAAVLVVCGVAMADTFGVGDNQFTLDFVTISGATNPASGIPTGSGYTFNGVPYDYRMGTFDITNDQWNKFMTGLGMPVTGSAQTDDGGVWRTYTFTGPAYPGANVPVTFVNWFMAAQFVNWLNTSTGHQAAYNFTGTQGTADYTFTTWPVAQAAGGTNLYRNKDAFYFLPNEDEWVKAAYWNGTTLQTYATKDGSVPTQGNGTSGTGWNYYDNTTGEATNPPGPWPVGSGSQELNGTYDMMGNVYQWLEGPSYPGPYTDLRYGTSGPRGSRGGAYTSVVFDLSSSQEASPFPFNGNAADGFRIASEVPEPAGLSLLALAGLALLRRRR